jgi:hypothetical protein
MRAATSLLDQPVRLALSKTSVVCAANLRKPCSQAAI